MSDSNNLREGNLLVDLKKFFYRDLLYYPVASLQAGSVKKHLVFLKGFQYVERKQLELLQKNRKSLLLDHARHHVPFFKDLDPEAGRKGMEGLPFLLKSDLQQSNYQLHSRAKLGKLSSKTTGGSTGQPVTLSKTRSALAWELAATWRGYSWAGIEAGDRQARFWGIPQTRKSQLKAKAIDLVCNRVRLSAFNFSEKDLGNYIGLLNRTKPEYFYGYVSMLSEFAKFLRRGNLSLSFPLKCIITTSEVLGEADRILLGETFGVPIYNEYGCAELGTVAHECEKGSLHLSEENMIVEVFDGSRPCADGEVGELVITELNNLSFPLIRYRTGDFGSVTAKKCDCGRTLRVLEDVQGRAYDFIQNQAGIKFHGEFIMYIFEDLRRQGARIRQFQVVQKDLDSFLVRIVPDVGYDSECEITISKKIQAHVDSDSKVDFEYVEAIEREKSGKLRLIKGLG